MEGQRPILLVRTAVIRYSSPVSAVPLIAYYWAG